MKPLSHFSTIWKLSRQVVSLWAKQGRIPGAIQPDGHHWLLPDDTERPPPLPGRQDYSKRKDKRSHRRGCKPEIVTRTVVQNLIKTVTQTKIVAETIKCKCCGISLKFGEFYFPIVDGEQDNSCPLCKTCNEEG